MYWKDNDENHGGYSLPAKRYVKGMNTNFYEGEDLTEKEKQMNRRDDYREYTNEVFRRTQEGGKLWLIERTDTNQVAFIDTPLDSMYSNSPNFGSKQLTWGDSGQWNMGFLGFLNKKDAEHYIKNPDPHIKFREGGCHCCGHGSAPIPIEVTEHIFDSTKEDVQKV